MKTNISIIRRHLPKYGSKSWTFLCSYGYVSPIPWILPRTYRGIHPEGWCECLYLMDQMWSEL